MVKKKKKLEARIGDFLTAEFMGARNFYFASKFLPKRRIFSLNFCIFGRRLSGKKRIF